MWHYTTLPVLHQIQMSGVLKPTQYRGQDRHRPTLWFSSNPAWEPTAAKRVGVVHGGKVQMMQRRLTFDEQHEMLGHARIRAYPDLKLMTFKEWARAVNADGEWVLDIVQGGIELGGNPAEWFATFDPLPRDHWRSVERWNGSFWEAIK